MNIIFGIIVGVFVFRFTHRNSKHFIAPRDRWRKSRFDIEYLKFNMALIAGVVSGLLIAVLLK